MPAVSVIVPVYNIKTLLPRCETSLRAQTWQDFEVWLRGGRDRRMQKSSHCECSRRFFECHYFFS